MADIRIISPIAVLSDCKDGWQTEFNIVSVEDGPFQYDVREWRLNHDEYRDGISLSEDEARVLLIKLGECFQVNVGELGTAQIPMPVMEQNYAAPERPKGNIVDILKGKGISFIDKREMGGALWIVAGHELDDLMKELKEQGYVFSFSEKGGKVTKSMPGWFLRYTSN